MTDDVSGPGGRDAKAWRDKDEPRKRAERARKPERWRPNGAELPPDIDRGAPPIGEPTTGNVGNAKRFKLIPFTEIEMSVDEDYVVDRMIPKGGFVVVWGPPKAARALSCST